MLCFDILLLIAFNLHALGFTVKACWMKC